MFRFIKDHYHTIAMFAWIIAVPVTLFTGLKNSVPFLVFISLYANIASESGAREAKKAQ